MTLLVDFVCVCCVCLCLFVFVCLVVVLFENAKNVLLLLCVFIVAD